MDTYLIYLLVTVLPNTIDLLGTVAIVTVCLLLIYPIVIAFLCDIENYNIGYSADSKEKAELKKTNLWASWLKNSKRLVILTLVLLSVKVFLPTGKEILMIAGGSYVLNNEEITKLPNNTAKAVNSFLEEYVTATEATTKETNGQ